MIRMGVMAMLAAMAAVGCSSSGSDKSQDTAAERQERMQSENERMRAEAEEQQRAEQQRAEQQRMQAQGAEQQRMEQQRMEQQRMEQQRAEQQRAAPQRQEPQAAEPMRSPSAVQPVESPSQLGARNPAVSDPNRDRSAADESGVEGADNTGVNERDRGSMALTPLDQSNERSDLRITQAIRKMVMDDDALSFNAKNVKIITSNGKVTLRGPVESTSERAKIESSARRVSGVKQVDNQIEINK